MRLSTSLSAVTTFCFLAAAPFASATVINSVQLSPTSGGGGIVVTANTITFSPGGFGLCPTANLCDANVSSQGTNMTYSGGAVDNTYNAFIGNLVVTPPSLPDPFIELFNAGGADQINFHLGGFTAPTVTNSTNCGSVTDGQTCVSYNGSPFTLQGKQNGASLGTIVSLGLFGTVTDVATGQISNFTGSFSQTFDNLTPAAIQAIIPSAGSSGAISSSFTGSLTATITPEPGSLFMAFGGLFLIAGAARRRKK